MHTDVAIIVGCYKQEDTVKEALSSARNQIQSLEYQAMPSFTVIESHDNCKSDGSGSSAHRNRVIENADADWIIWLDADDLMPSNYLNSLWQTKLSNCTDDLYELYATPVQFVAGCRLDKFGLLELSECSGQVRAVSSQGQTAIEKKYPMAMAAMFSRCAWMTIGGFDEKLSRGTDIDFWIRLRALKGDINIAYATSLLRRNVKPQGLTLSSTPDEEQEAIIKMHKSLHRLREKHGIEFDSMYLPYKIPYTHELDPT